MRATYRGVPLTDADVDRIRATPPAAQGEHVPTGLLATGRHSRHGLLPRYRPDPATPGRTPLPEDFTGSIRIGGPLPEFWIWLATTVLALIGAWVAPYLLGPAGLALVVAAYVGSNLGAGYVLSRPPASQRQGRAAPWR
jgi:hypothetical protein